MLNYLWLAMLVVGVVVGGATGRLGATVEGALKGAEGAVTLALGLVGVMALWLGMMRLAERAGLVNGLARVLRPVLRRLFPDVPEGHPALGSIVMNLSANMLGLTNAATPLGLRAMRELETLNPHRGTATNAMCTFLAINTSSVQLLPVTAIAVLAAAGSRQPTAIVGTALVATACSTVAGLLAVKILERWRVFRLPSAGTVPAEAGPGDPLFAEAEGGVGSPSGVAAAPMPAWGWGVLLGLAGLFAWFLVGLAGSGGSGDMAGASLAVRTVNAVSLLAIPFLLVLFPVCAALRSVPVYEEFVEGAKEGFQVGVRLIPYLVAMLVAVGVFRGAGGIDWLARALKPALDAIGLPAELLPMSLVRPLSGSATLGLLTDLVKTHGPDSLLARMGGTIFGSTETTFYVIAVYFGAVGVRRARHAVLAGLFADAVGVVASVAVCRSVFG